MGITPQQFEQLRSRLGGRRSTTPASAPASRSIAAATGESIVLGIDPSLRGTGYGIIRSSRRHAESITHGTIKAGASWARSRCLLNIAESLRAVIREHRPTVCVVEGLFFAQNLQTALIMGEARGAGLVAAAEAGIEIFEIAPRKVKQAIVGYGAAQKNAVARMVQRLLQLDETPAPDAADALALALAFVQETGRFNLTPLKQI